VPKILKIYILNVIFCLKKVFYFILKQTKVIYRPDIGLSLEIQIH